MDIKNKLKGFLLIKMPSTGCSVPKCSNRGGHRYPSDPELKKKWIIAIKRDKWTPTNSSVVCKEHFRKEDYITHTYYGKYYIYPNVNISNYYNIL